MSTKTENMLTLEAIHSSAYTEVVRPRRAFFVSRYFLERWLPLLGTNAAWVVVCLRQLAYWNDRQDWWKGSYDALAGYVGLARATTFNALSADFVACFVTREGGARHGDVCEPNRYRVQMDDPLVPADARRLRELLTQYREDHPTLPAVDQAQGALQACLATERTTLLATEGPGQIDSPQSVQTVTQIVSDVFLKGVLIAAAEQHLIVEQCQALYQHLVVPGYAVRVSHYLRGQWARLLKPVGLWTLLYLRSKCYWKRETDEVRDRCTVSDLRMLAEVLGCHIRTVERALKRLAEQGFIHERQRRRTGQGRRKGLEVQFNVQMWDPVAADDWARYQELLAQEATGAGMTSSAAIEEELAGTKLNYEAGQSVTNLNDDVTKLNYGAEQTVTNLNDGVTKLNYGAEQTVTNLNGIKDYKESFEYPKIKDQKQKTPVPAPGKVGKAGRIAAAVALSDVLDVLRIVG
ncbi:MAG: hypothetical protein GXP41_00050, partial [Chloroflexi bacterium]|nr:hypothetical protein [Chloroflexota bacterium]